MFPIISVVSITNQLTAFWGDAFVLWAMVLTLSLSLAPRLWRFVRRMLGR